MTQLTDSNNPLSRDSRVMHEAKNIAGSVLSGTAWRQLFRRALDALLIGVFLYAFDISLARMLPLPPCHYLAQGRCFIFERAVLLRLLLLLPPLLLASYLSTTFCRSERLAHSASVSALVLLGAAGALIWGHFSFWYVLAAIPAITLTTFYAYRLTLR